MLNSKSVPAALAAVSFAALLLAAAPLGAQEQEPAEERAEEAAEVQAEVEAQAPAPPQTEVEAPPQEEIDRWRVKLDLTFSGASGNQDLRFFDGGFQVTHLRTEAAEVEVAARARSGSQDGDRIAESYSGSLRVDALPDQPWSPFAFASVERDRFRELDLRSNAGGGIKYTFYRNDRTELSLSSAVLHSREDLRPLDAPTHTDGRLSWRFKGYRELRDGVRLEHVSAYQPVWDRSEDYQARTDTQLSVQLFSIMAVTAGHQYERDSTPPEGVEPDDHYVKLGVQVQL